MKRIVLFIAILFFQENLSAKLPDLIPYRKGNLWGYCDSTKKIIIPCKFSQANLFNGDSAWGMLDTTKGYIMRNGNFHPSPPIKPVSIYWPGIVSSPYGDYPYGYPFGDSYGSYNYTWAFSVVTVECTGLTPVEDSITNLYGYENCKGKIIIPCIYREASYFNDGLAQVTVGDSLKEFINEKGKAVLKYDMSYELSSFHDGTSIISHYGKSGVINKKGEYIIPAICSEIIDRGNFFTVLNNDMGTYWVFTKDGKWNDHRSFGEFTEGENSLWMTRYEDEFGISHVGFLNKDGKEIVPFKYYDGMPFYDGLAAVTDDEYWGFVNEKGELVIPLKYYLVNSFQNGVAIIGDNNSLYGLINKKGEAVTAIKYNEINAFENGIAKVQNQDGLWGFLNEKGEEIVPVKYKAIGGFENDMFKVQNDAGLWGYINEKGEAVIPIKYMEIGNFENDTAKVKNEAGLWGFINLKGEVVIPIKYKQIYNFGNGIAKVQNESYKWGFINEKGVEVIEVKYLEEYDFKNGLLAVKSDNEKWGFVDSTGKNIIPCKYVLPLDGGFLENGLCEINKTGYIDVYGTEYWEE